MSENVFLQPESVPRETSLQIATLGTGSAANGWTLILDGQTTASQKNYKRIDTGGTLTSGDRVVVVKISGTYVILGKLTT